MACQNNIKIDEQSNEEDSKLKKSAEDLTPVEKAQQTKKMLFLNTEIDSQYGKSQQKDS